MPSSEIIKRFDSGKDQLSLDFANSPSSAKTRVADSVDAITSGKITFHPERSEIGVNNFALKVSYMGRSYSLNGIYKKEQIRSFQQEDFTDIAIRIIRFDSILAFRNDRYISAFLPPKDFNELIKNAKTILSSPHYNTTIH